MNKSDLQLWDVLVPAFENDQPVTGVDEIVAIGDFIVDQVGGYTLPYQVRQEGAFQNADGELLNEESTIIRVAANLETMTKIACFIKTYLKQESVMFYQVSPLAFFV